MNATEDRTEPDAAGLAAARAVAGWHLGYASWADTLIDAYLNPKQAMDRLRQEKDDD